MKRIAIALAICASTPAKAQDIGRWRAFTEEASLRFGIPMSWIERVMQAESAGRTRLGGQPIVSSAGAMGLMQLMPGTWADMRARLGLGADPHMPRDNILAGTFYLRLMYERFGYPGLFGAYNAGPARYAAYVEVGRPLPLETRNYMAKVESGPSVRAPAAGHLPTAPAAPGLFYKLQAADPSRSQTGPFPSPFAAPGSPRGLFVSGG